MIRAKLAAAALTSATLATLTACGSGSGGPETVTETVSSSSSSSSTSGPTSASATSSSSTASAAAATPSPPAGSTPNTDTSVVMEPSKLTQEGEKALGARMPAGSTLACTEKLVMVAGRAATCKWYIPSEGRLDTTAKVVWSNRIGSDVRYYLQFQNADEIDKS